MRIDTRHIPLILIVFLLTACTGCEEQTGSRHKTAEGFGIPEKQTMTGVVGICTTSDDMELITEDSTSLFVETFNKVVFGSCEPGDSVHVTYMDIDGHLISSVVINLRQLAQRWKAVGDSTTTAPIIKLLPDNHVRSYADETDDEQYIQWNLFDGQLMLTSQPDSLQPVTVDTFTIRSLNRDSLVLRKENHTILYIKH